MILKVREGFKGHLLMESEQFLILRLTLVQLLVHLDADSDLIGVHNAQLGKPAVLHCAGLYLNVGIVQDWRAELVGGMQLKVRVRVRRPQRLEGGG